MTFDLKKWQARNGFTYETAAAELELSRATYGRYVKRNNPPRWLVLACRAVDDGINGEK